MTLGASEGLSSEDPEQAKKPPNRLRLHRCLSEPLLHFVLIGFALFASYAWMQRGQPANVDHQIILTIDDLRQLILSFQARWGREPTPAEFKHLAEEKVQEEILYREALAMGLDKDDTIVKRRMAQKMQFLAEDVATAHEPTTDQLRTWYTANSQRFELPARIALRHLYFSPDRRFLHARDDAAKALTELAGQPEDCKFASSLADQFMGQDYYRDRSSDEMAKEFGPQFAQALFKLKPGSWRGPIESGYGWHLVFVESVTPGRIPEFEEVESDVKTEWLGEQKEQAWRKAYQQMRAKYTVLLPQVPDKVATPNNPSHKDVPSASGEGLE